MQRKVEQYIKKWNMISRGDVVIVGVSGGADSVCLFCILDGLREELGFELRAVHVNHGIRGEAADRDEGYVRKLCEERGVSCEVYHVDVPEYAREKRMSEEEAGRELRRMAFQKTARKHGGTRIALAHHQEDNAETFLLHLSRGSRLRGLGGIYPVNGEYIRPLLCVGRAEIEEYLRSKKMEYCTDMSNLEDMYTRNRIRNHVLPYLKEYVNTRTVEHINGAMEQLREIEMYMEEECEEARLLCTAAEEGKTVIYAEQFKQQKGLIRRMVLRKVLADFAGSEKDLEQIHIVSAEELFEKQTGKSVDLPYNMRAVRTYEGVEIRRTDQIIDEEQEETILALSHDKTVIRCGDWEISCRIFRNSGDMGQVPKKTYTKWFDYDIIEQSVHVRTRRAGDRIVIDKKGSTQKLKSYFINEKIPAWKRNEILLIAEGSQILWVVGYRQSTAYQVTEQTTRILEITINGGTYDGRKD